MNILKLFLEWFSFECRKTKTKVITLANHIRQYIVVITFSQATIYGANLLTSHCRKCKTKLFDTQMKTALSSGQSDNTRSTFTKSNERA